MTPAVATPITTDASGLYGERLKLANPDDHVVLPEIISKEPLGPAVRQGDDQWFNVVKWVHFAMINAEELGVTRGNVDENAEIRPIRKSSRLLGTEGNYGEEHRPYQGLGLSHRQACRQLRRECSTAMSAQGSPLKIDARPERAVDQGRPAIRAADPLTGLRRASLRARARATDDRRAQAVSRRGRPGVAVRRPERAQLRRSALLCRRVRRAFSSAPPPCNAARTCARAYRVGLRLLEQHRRLRHQPDAHCVLREYFDLSAARSGSAC